MKAILSSTILVVLCSISVMAQQRTPGVDARQKTQRGRIVDGRLSGQITNREARMLSMQQRHIRRSERMAKTDGNVTMAEQHRLDRKQDRASRNIRRAKHNNLRDN